MCVCHTFWSVESYHVLEDDVGEEEVKIRMNWKHMCLTQRNLFFLFNSLFLFARLNNNLFVGIIVAINYDILFRGFIWGPGHH